MNNLGAKAYHKTSVETASKEKIMLMLYEGCIRNFKKCKVAIENKDMPEKGLYLGKAQDIVNELCNSLNFDVAGELPKKLEALYLHIIDESTQANINNNPEKIQHCIKLLETLYSGWKEVVDKTKGTQATNNVAAAGSKK